MVSISVAQDLKPASLSVKPGGGSIMVWAFLAAFGTPPLILIDDATHNESSRRISEV